MSLPSFHNKFGFYNKSDYYYSASYDSKLRLSRTIRENKRKFGKVFFFKALFIRMLKK